MKTISLILAVIYFFFSIFHSNYVLLGFTILFLFLGIVIAPLVEDSPGEEN